jgi:hypothetical protein
VREKKLAWGPIKIGVIGETRIDSSHCCQEAQLGPNDFIEQVLYFTRGQNIRCSATFCALTYLLSGGYAHRDHIHDRG